MSDKSIEMAGLLFYESGETEKLRAHLARVIAAGKAVVEMNDRYCSHDMTVDEYDLGVTIEALRQALKP